MLFGVICWIVVTLRCWFALGLWMLSCFTFDSWVLDLDCYYLCLLVVWAVNSVVCLLFFLFVVVDVLGSLVFWFD